MRDARGHCHALCDVEGMHGLRGCLPAFSRNERSKQCSKHVAAAETAGLGEYAQIRSSHMRACNRYTIISSVMQIKRYRTESRYCEESSNVRRSSRPSILCRYLLLALNASSPSLDSNSSFSLVSDSFHDKGVFQKLSCAEITAELPAIAATV